MESLKIKVANVKCDGCVATIKAGLKDMNGVESVEVDLVSTTVSINGVAIDHLAISQRLAALGYPEVGE